MSDTLPQDIDFAVNRDGELPVGTQLVWKVRSLIESGALEPGDKLPSVRTLAEAAGVNVNTARAVYGRLERAGLIRSEQGRGTFVTPQPPMADPESRGELVRQIAELEAQLLRRPVAVEAASARTAGGRLTTTEELRDIRDGLSARLRALDAERAEVLRQLAEIDQPGAEPQPRRSSASLRGAKVRWVGA
jgi:GntR family transcriptional regulator